MMEKYSLQIVIIIVFVLGTAYVCYKQLAKSNQKGRYKLDEKLLSGYRKIPILNKILIYVSNELAYTDSYSWDTAETKALHFINTNVLKMFGIIIFVGLLYNNIVYTFGSIIFAVIFFKVEIIKQVNKEYAQLMKDLLRSVSDLADCYKMEPVVANALEKCDHNNTSEYLIDLIQSTVANETNSDEQKMYFDDTVEIPILRMLGSICQIENEIGDTLVSVAQGFLRDIEIIRYDVSHEIMKALKIENKYGGFDIIIISPFILLFAMNLFWNTNFPAMKHYDNTWYDMLIDVVFVASICIVYYFYWVKKVYFINVSDNLIDFSIKGNKGWDFIEKIFIPNEEKRKEFKDKLAKARYIGGLRTFIQNKLVTTIVTFVVLNICIISGLHTIKSFTYNSIDTFGINSTQYLPADKVAIHKVDDILMQLDQEEFDKAKFDFESSNYKEGMIVDRYKNALPNYTDTEAANEGIRFIQKYEKYNTYTITWYVYLVVILLTIIAWFSQDFILHIKLANVKERTTEEVFNIATMNVVLSNTYFNTFKCLSLLKNQVVLLKNNYSEAIELYTIDPDYALDNLAAGVDNVNFKVYTNKLKHTNYSLSIRDAYADAYEEKKRLQQEREEITNSVIEKNQNLLKLLIYIPVGVVIGLKILLPFLLLSFKSIFEVFSRLQAG